MDRTGQDRKTGLVTYKQDRTGQEQCQKPTAGLGTVAKRAVRQCACNVVIQRRVPVITVRVEKQRVLHILSVCL